MIKSICKAGALVYAPSVFALTLIGVSIWPATAIGLVMLSVTLVVMPAKS